MSIFAVDKDGNRQKIAGVGLPGPAATINGVNTLAVTAGDNIKLNQTDGELKIGVSLDNGTIRGDIALLDDLKNPGTYTWLDNGGTLGKAGELWNVVVSQSKYTGVHPSVTQTLFKTYGLGTKGRVLTRVFYYANNPQWTPWRELVSLDQISGVNLLDNWYFPRPVNQRGKTEYTAAGYTIDRWRLGTGGAKVALTTGGLVLSKESSAYNYVALGTLFENSESLKGKTVTLSVLTTEGLFTGTGPLLDLSGARVVYCTYNSDGDIFRAYFSEGLLCAEFIAYGSNAAPVQAVKLELGPVQTLAHQDADGTWVLNGPPPDPALELAKCQRYLRPLYIMYDHASSYVPTNTVNAIRQFNHEMRANPIILNPEDLGYNPFRFGGGTWSKERSKAPTIRHAAGPQGNVAIITYFLPENYSGDMHDVGLVSYKTAGTFSPLWLSAEL